MGKHTKYSRVYKVEWEKNANLKDWIRPVTGDPGKAYCKYCKTLMRPHFNDLLLHSYTKKHQVNAQTGSNARTLFDAGIKAKARVSLHSPLIVHVVGPAAAAMATTGSSNEVFLSLEKCLLEEYNVKESLAEDVRDLEQVSRRVAAIMQAIHQQDETATLESCSKARNAFQEVEQIYLKISKKIPEGGYYKFLPQWQNVSNRLCFLASLIIYLESGSLATREEVMGMLGVQVDRRKGFHIDLEDYLFGLLSLANELSRLAVNSVISGNYKRPLEISKFVKELESGFRLLNLKNDFLRKKFDGLKYDVKKIEQVVYDLKIRGLIQSSDDETEE